MVPRLPLPSLPSLQQEKALFCFGLRGNFQWKPFPDAPLPREAAAAAASPAASRCQLHTLLPIQGTEERTCLSGESGTGAALCQNAHPQLSPSRVILLQKYLSLGKPVKPPLEERCLPDQHQIEFTWKMWP